jgi:3-oxoacyl-[acyl-carrier-protein] synthase-3
LTPERVGIASIGTYFPAGYQTSVEIAAATGIPRDVIETKFGLRGKHIASPDEHVSQMAAAAARPLLAGGEATEVDVLIYFGSAHKDYHLWSVAPKIQALLGLRQAFTLELMDTSACGPVALKVARDLLVADDRLRAVLLVGASRESHVIDYRNERSRFAFNFADGAAAAVVTRGPQTHEILASAIITDGAFADDVRIPAGGSVHPPSAETIERRMHFLDVTDPARMKSRLDPVALDRFIEVTRGAVGRSGCTLEEVDYLAVLHTKRSLFDALLGALGLEEEQSFYLQDFGHISAMDPLISLEQGERAGRLRPGDLAVALSAGTGYSWAATAIRW